MWEYSCAYSPIWSRGADLDTGPIDARDLGLDEALRADLADWNERCEVAADPSGMLPEPTGPSAWRALMSEAWALAARVQRGLGDDWTVWCLGGGGDGGLRDEGAFASARRTGGPHLLLDRRGLHEWTPARESPALERLQPALRREVHHWLDGADRTPAAENRAAGIELARWIGSSLPGSRVMWFGGDEVPR